MDNDWLYFNGTWIKKRVVNAIRGIQDQLIIEIFCDGHMTFNCHYVDEEEYENNYQVLLKQLCD